MKKTTVFLVVMLFLTTVQMTIAQEEEPVIPLEIRKEYNEKGNKIWRMINWEFPHHGTSAELSAALDDLLATMNRYPEYAWLSWSHALLAHSLRPNGNGMDRALSRPGIR